jgi:preprotein translocase subunit SecE
MNRAVRRQQRAQEAKQKAAAARAPRISMPRAGTGQRAPRSDARGVRRLVPRFLQDIWSELMKVTWPSREDTLHMAVVVVIVTIIFGAILGGIDIAFGWVIDRTLLDQDALFR